MNTHGVAASHDVLVRGSHVVAVRTEDGTVLYDPGRRVVHVLNPSGTEIWDRLDGAVDVDLVSRGIAEDYGAPSELVARDVGALLSELAAAGLVLPAERHDPPPEAPFVDPGGFLEDPVSHCPQPFAQRPAVHSTFEVAGLLVGVRSDSPGTDELVRATLSGYATPDRDGPANFNVWLSEDVRPGMRSFATRYRGRCPLVRARDNDAVLEALRRAVVWASAPDVGLVHASIAAVVGPTGATLLPSSLRPRLEREAETLGRSDLRLLPAPYVALDPASGSVVELEDVTGRLVETARHPVVRIVVSSGPEAVADWESAVRLLMPDVIREPRVPPVRGLTAMVLAARTASIAQVRGGGPIAGAVMARG